MSQMFNNPFECYEAIGSRLAADAPEPWDSITIDFEIIEIDDVSEQIIRYVPRRKPEKTKQFFIQDPDFQDCFFALARLTSTPDKGLFRKCRFTLFADGRYETNFDYNQGP